MIDFAKITIKAGDGGRGAGTFTHIKGKRYGKADGGNGGSGGDVYFEASRDLNTLEPFRFIKDYSAGSGKNGFSNHRRGADGEDLVIKVPLGTQIKVESARPPASSLAGEVGRGKWKVESEGLSTSQIKVEGEGLKDGQAKGESEYQENAASIEYDLAEDGQRVLAARGGNGGRGNSHLRDEYGRRPRSGEAGGTGEAYNLILELKLIADVGLIGLPNAGKSTLLTKLTAAQVKIANYPFTTLEPNLGVLKKSITSSQGTTSTTGFDSSRDTRDTLNSRDTLVFADIPGLIEGASEGRGLGDLFLRHIERTKILVHMIDITSDDLWRDYQVIRNELKQYSKDLSKKKDIIVLNKADLIGDEQIKLVAAEFKNHRKKVFVISADRGIGVSELAGEIKKRLRAEI